MKGRFAGLINLASVGYAAAIFFLAINYLLGTVGTTAPKSLKDGLCANQANEYVDKICKKFNLQYAAAALAIIVGIVQAFTCVLALGTKVVNWVIWVIAHVAASIISLIAMALVFAAYADVRSLSEDWCKSMQGSGSGQGQGSGPGSRPGSGGQACSDQTFPGHASYSMPVPESLNAVVFLFGIMLLLNIIFCILATVLMVVKRASTKEEGGPAILENRSEALVQKVSSRLLNGPKTAVEPTPAPEPAPTAE